MKKRLTREATNQGEPGLALIALLVIVLVLGVIVYAFSSMIASHQMAAESGYNAMKAFYIKEGALELGMKFVVDRWAAAESYDSYEQLGADYLIFDNEPMGEGTFSIWATETCGGGECRVEFYAVGEVTE